MALTYDPPIGIVHGNNLDMQGYEVRRSRLWNVATTLTAAIATGTPPDGTVGYRTSAAAKRIVFYDTAIAADVEVPRKDYAESITATWSFAPGAGVPPFATPATLPSTGSTATMVTNLNANYLRGYLEDGAAATVNTIALRDANGRVKVEDPSASKDAVNLGFMQTYYAGTAGRLVKFGPAGITLVNSIISESGQVLTLNGGASTITTATGNLTLASVADSHVILAPGGTGVVLAGNLTAVPNTTSIVEGGFFGTPTAATVGGVGLVGTQTAFSTFTSALEFHNSGQTESRVALIGTYTGTASAQASSLFFCTHNGTSLTEWWRITEGGNLRSNGPQTITTSSGVLTLGTGSGAGRVDISPDTTGAVYFNTNSISSGKGAGGNTIWELGGLGTGDRGCYLDFHCEDALYTDYALRLGRAGGSTGVTALTHRGTGAFRLVAQEATALDIYTTNTLRWSVTAAGIWQSNGAQTIQTSTGHLTLATAAGNGNIVFTNHGTGLVQVDSVTASSMVGTNSSKQLVAVTIGAGLTYDSGSTTLSSTGLQLDVKDPARVATTANLAATYAAGVLTATANGSINVAGIDGVTTLAVNDRILVKDQTTTADNGIYSLTTVGTAGTPFVLTRTTDADTAAEVTEGMYSFVNEGTTNINSGWIQILVVTTLGTDPITWKLFSRAGTFTAGNGMVLSGGVFHFSQSATYTTGALFYASSGSAVAPTGALTGILQGNGSSAPTAITGTVNVVAKWGTSGTTLTTSAITDAGAGTVAVASLLTAESATSGTLALNYTGTGTYVWTTYQISGTGKWTLGSTSADDSFRLIVPSSITVLTVLPSGNIGLNATSFGTSAAKVVAVGAGTAPTTSPADTVQAWVEDMDGAATAGLYLRTESGARIGIGNRSTVGTLELAGNVTDATAKLGALGAMHYTNAEEPVLVAMCRASVSENIVRIGGGSASFNAATSIEFYTAATSTTTTGSLQMLISSAGAVTVFGLTANRLISTVSGVLTSVSTLTSWIAGTANQITVADDGDGSITLSLPSSVIIAGLTVSGLSSDRLVSTVSGVLTSVSALTAWVAGTANQITVTDDLDGSITLSLPQAIATGSSPTFTGITLTGLTGILQGRGATAVNAIIGTVDVLPKWSATAPYLVSSSITDAGGVITLGTDTLMLAGLLVMGSASVTGTLSVTNTIQGLTLTASRLMASDVSQKLVSVSALTSWIAGTANQVTVTDDGDGSVTLSLPQSIATGSSPTFTGITISGLTGMLRGNGASAVTAISGTSGRIVKWSSTTLIGDSIISESAQVLTLTGGASTLTTDTGNLTLASGAGGGSILVVPHGAGTTKFTGTVWLNNSASQDIVSQATSGSLGLAMGRIASTPSNSTVAFIGYQDTGGPAGTAGGLILIPRTSTAAPASVWILGGATTPTALWKFVYDGTLEAQGARTITTSTGALTLATAASSNVVITPGGTGILSVSSAMTVTGAVTLSNLDTLKLVQTNGGKVLISSNDLPAGTTIATGTILTGSGTTGTIPKWTNTSVLGNSVISEGATFVTCTLPLKLSNITVSRLVQNDSSGLLEDTTLVSWVVGTANQVTVADDGDGSITLSLPQNIHTGATPTFTGLTLSGLSSNRLISTVTGVLTSVSTLTSWVAGTTNQVTVTDDGDGSVTLSLPSSVVIASLALSSLLGDRLVSSVTGVLTSVSTLTSWIAGNTNQITVTNDGDGSVTLTLPQDIHSAAVPTFQTVILTTLTNNRLVYQGGGFLATVSTLTSWVAGTANRVTVTDDLDGTITLTGPQDIHTGASPTFVGLNLTGLTNTRVVFTSGGALSDDDDFTWATNSLSLTNSTASSATNMVWRNLDTSAAVLHGTSVLNYFASTGNATPLYAGGIFFSKTQEWTSTTSTQTSSFLVVVRKAGATHNMLYLTPTGSTIYAYDIGTTFGGSYLDLNNQTDAADGAQQYSPALILTGWGWKTNATAGSQLVQFGMATVPVQGSSAPIGYISFQNQINATGWTEVWRMTSSVLTNNRLMVRDSNGAFGVTVLSAWVSGTANQVTVTDNGSGGVTLSLPSSVTTGSLTLSGLTATRVLIAGTSGLITDDGDFTYVVGTDTLTIGPSGGGTIANVQQVLGEGASASDLSLKARDRLVVQANSVNENSSAVLQMQWYTTHVFQIDSSGFSIGGTIAIGATAGHLRIPNCSGTPTGVPGAGNASCLIDTAANKLWVYIGGWKSVTLS